MPSEGQVRMVGMGLAWESLVQGSTAPGIVHPWLAVESTALPSFVGQAGALGPCGLPATCLGGIA